MIAHRVSTVRDADLILVLVDGRVVERGHARRRSWRGRASTPRCTAADARGRAGGDVETQRHAGRRRRQGVRRAADAPAAGVPAPARRRGRRSRRWSILGASLVELAQPWLTQQAIDRYIAAGDLAGLRRLVFAAFLGLLIVGFVCEYGQTYILQTVGQRIMHTLRMEVYGHLQRLDLRFYDRNPVGRLMTRVTTDVDALNDLFASGLDHGLRRRARARRHHGGDAR